jgi:2'-5' RNA ligase
MAKGEDLEAASLALDEGRKSLSPVFSYGVNAAVGSDVTGREFDVTEDSVRLATPILLEELYDAFTEEGLTGSLKTLPSAIGIGAQTYGSETGERYTREVLQGHRPRWEKPVNTKANEKIDADPQLRAITDEFKKLDTEEKQFGVQKARRHKDESDEDYLDRLEAQEPLIKESLYEFITSPEYQDLTDVEKREGIQYRVREIRDAEEEDGGEKEIGVNDSYRNKSTGEILAIRNAEGSTVALGERGSDGKPSVTLPRAEFEKQFEKTEHKFSSTQVDLPEKESKEVRSLASKLIPESEVYTDPSDDSYGYEEKPHVTVKYGLHTENAADVRRALANESPVEVKLGKVSIFPAKGDAGYDVVKVDVESPALHALNKKISESLKVTDTHPEYKPHVTLAYVKKGQGQKYVGNNSLEGKTLKFDSITFSSSNGETVPISLA